jgi:5-methyltetrahydropteroyltriglutamate--homocysteine methyltransferase
VDRVLTTHVGSLLRPPQLVDALRAAERHDRYDESAFSAALHEAVVDVVRRQVDTGIDIVDDGEMGKTGWIIYLYNRVSGIEPRVVSRRKDVLPAALDTEADANTHSLYTEAHIVDDEDPDEGVTWVCTGPMRYDSTELDRDIANLKAGLDGLTVSDAFIPAVAPGSIYWIKNEHYDSDEDFVFAFADALHEEYTRIVDAGFLVSVDDAVLWHKLATIRLQGGAEADYREWADVRIEAVNHALRGIPQDRVRYHICSGSNHSPHTQDAGLHEIIDLVLKVNAGAYLIEQGNARHEHEWRIWEDVDLPDDKIVVPGVVTHQTMMVEHPELVAQRITRLAGLIGREHVIAGTDCGFAQDAVIRRVPVWTQWAKLQSLVDGARIATRQLWGASTPAAARRT